MKRKLFTERRKVDKYDLHTCQNYGRKDRREIKREDGFFDDKDKEMTEEEYYEEE